MSNKAKNTNTKADNVEQEEVVVLNKKTKTKAQKNAKQSKQSKAKKKNQNVVAKKLKETGSELKKVSWPPLSKVVKQTGVVIAVVIMFTAIIFGIDRFLSWIFDLLIG